MVLPREFAGEGDYEVAYVPDQAREVLSRFDEGSAHFDVLPTPGEAG
jgi:hypothetical protein